MAHYYDCLAVIVDSLKDVAADLSRRRPARPAPGLSVVRGRRHRCGGHPPSAQAAERGQQAEPPLRRLRQPLADSGLWQPLDALGRGGRPDRRAQHTSSNLTRLSDLSRSCTTRLPAGRRSSTTWTLTAWSRGSSKGITAAEVASVLFGEDTRNSREKALRQLNRLVGDGKIHREEGNRGGRSGSEPTRHYPLSLLHQGRRQCVPTHHVCPSRVPSRGLFPCPPACEANDLLNHHAYPSRARTRHPSRLTVPF